MNRFLILFLFLFLMIGFVNAHGEETFDEAERIIESKVSCEELSEDQLEILGDYYMEQMHPGEAHERMDEMMGGEGSENLREIHIGMARNFYCGEHQEMSAGMMDAMMDRGNMMDSSFKDGDGMMDGIYGMGSVWFVYVLVTAFVFGVVFWGTYKFVIKGR